MQVVKDNGADIVINHKEDSVVDAVAKATGGRGVDVILEMNAHLNLDKDLTMLARYGRIVLIGNRGRIEIDPRGAMGREAAILGMVLFNLPPSDLQWIHTAIGVGLASGALTPIVNREFALADAPRAHQQVLESGALGKLVLVP
jgi:NADPH2:quinone reductase